MNLGVGVRRPGENPLTMNGKPGLLSKKIALLLLFLTTQIAQLNALSQRDIFEIFGKREAKIGQMIDLDVITKSKETTVNVLQSGEYLINELRTYVESLQHPMQQQLSGILDKNKSGLMEAARNEIKPLKAGLNLSENTTYELLKLMTMIIVILFLGNRIHKNVGDPAENAGLGIARFFTYGFQTAVGVTIVYLFYKSAIDPYLGLVGDGLESARHLPGINKLDEGYKDLTENEIPAIVNTIKNQEKVMFLTRTIRSRIFLYMIGVKKSIGFWKTSGASLAIGLFGPQLYEGIIMASEYIKQRLSGATPEEIEHATQIAEEIINQAPESSTTSGGNNPLTNIQEVEDYGRSSPSQKKSGSGGDSRVGALMYTGFLATFLAGSYFIFKPKDKKNQKTE